jgi:formiminotetrahydrofolate cyclodeaminase
VLADRDAHAFDSVMVGFKMPKETDEQKAARSAAIQAGYLAAASVPQEVARKAVDLMELAEDATAMGNPQAASDGLSRLLRCTRPPSVPSRTSRSTRRR